MDVKENVRSKVQNNIKMYRERVGLTQRQLSERLGVDPSTVAYWETGKSAPNADTLVQLCDIFGVKPTVLMGVVDEEATRLQEAEALLALYKAAPPDVRLAVDSLLKRK